MMSVSHPVHVLNILVVLRGVLYSKVNVNGSQNKKKEHDIMCSHIWFIQLVPCD